MWTSSAQKDSGYTLTELLVVLMLLGFLTSIGPPAIERALPSVMLKTYTRHIETDINMMRREAMQSASIYEFVIEPGERAYIIKTQDKVLKRRHWPKRISIRVDGNAPTNDGEKQTAFFARPDGRLEGSGLSLISRGKESHVFVSPLTKRLRLQNE